MRDHDDVKFALDTFETLWAEGIPVQPQDVNEIKKKSYLNDEFTPFEIFIKFLVEYFGKSIDYDPDDVHDLPTNYSRLRYQGDAVNEGFEKLKRYNGFFLADVVGLGKTIVSIMIAKKFAFHNGLRTKVLIVHPPSIESSWKNTVNDFNLPFTIDFITNGSLHKIKHPENYDLIIVDEAHKFRSDTSEMFNALQTLCKTPRRNPGPYGEREKKVILVSATPLNNKPEDIRNLVLLFQDGRNASIDSVTNIIHFFRPLIDLFNKLKNEHNKVIALKGIKNIYEEIRLKIIGPLTVRRTRTDIWDNKEYREDLTRQGLKFPVVEAPKPIYYKLDSNLNELFDETMGLLQNIVTGLKYYRYQAIKFLEEPFKSRYDNADTISNSLAFIMKTLLVKRLDSSFYSFIESLKRFSLTVNPMIITATNIDTRANRMYLTLQFKVNPFGNIHVNFDVSPTDFGNFNLAYNIGNFPIPLFNPYAVTYTSYPFDKGTLNLDGNWHVLNKHINSINHIVVDSATLAIPIKDDDNKKIPMHIVMFFIRDIDRKIDVQVPITGNLNDPSYHLWGTILHVLENIVVKPPSFPYTSVKLAQTKNKEDYEKMEWQFRQTTLSGKQKSQLKKIASYLSSHPNASVVIAPYNFETEEKEMILWFEAKKLFYIHKQHLSVDKLTKNDSTLIAQNSVKDTTFIHYIEKLTRTDSLDFTLQGRSRRLIGEHKINSLYNTLLATRENQVLAFFRDKNIANRVIFEKGVNDIPASGFSHYLFYYKEEPLAALVNK